MSNVSNNLNAEIFLGEPYLTWLQANVFPYIYGGICLVVILLGSVFNVAYVKLYVKQTIGLIKGLSVTLVVVDVIAYVAFLLPSVYFSFGNVDEPPSVLCYEHGIATITLFCLQQGVLAYGLIVSVFALKRKTSLEPRLCVTVFWIVFLVLLIILGTCLPIILGNGYAYVKTEYQCGINRDRYLLLIHLEFAVFVFLVAFFALVCFVVLIIDLIQRRRSNGTAVNTTAETIEVADETPSCRDMPSSLNPSSKHQTPRGSELSGKESQYLKPEDSAFGNEFQSHTNVEEGEEKRFTRSRPEDREDSKMSQSSILTGLNSSAASIDDTVRFSPCPVLPGDSLQSVDEHRPAHGIRSQSVGSLSPFPSRHTSTIRDIPHGPKMSSASPRRAKPQDRQQLLLSDIVHTSIADKSSSATRQAVHFLVLWFCVALCWAPYVVCVYVDIHGDIWWPGWLTVGAMCATFSYCVKPMVILGVRRQLLKSSNVVLPQKLTDRASRFQTSVKRLMDKVDKRAFK